MSYKITASQAVLGDEFLAHLSTEEAEGAAEVSARPDTISISVVDGKGGPVGYVVFGPDGGDMLAVYYARAFVPGFGAMMMRQFIGVAKVTGKPLRMHVSGMRDIQAKARMFGVNVAYEGADSDGIMQGVFSNVVQVK